MYLKVLKDLLLFSKMTSLEMFFSEFYEVNWIACRTKFDVPEIRYEAQRHNFWYKTGLRVNVLLQRNIVFFWKH